jgi:hypothetical protein
MRSVLCGAMLTIATAVFAGESGGKLTVSAGKHDRKDVIISFAYPENANGNVLVDESGNDIIIQRSEPRTAWFVLGELKNGESKTYSLVQKKIEEVEAAVKAQRAGTAVNVSVGGKAVLSYQGEKTPLPEGFEPQLQRGGYIFPIFTPGGKLVVDGYPPNHKHHHGIWWAWTKTEFEGRKPDFWNMLGKNATVEFVSLEQTWEGSVHGGLAAKHRFVDLGVPGGKAVLNEIWQVRIYNAGTKHRIFDLISTQECATDSPLTQLKYLYGGLGVRGHRDWNQKNADLFLTSEGKDRSNGNETRGRWCRMSGKVEGGTCSIAILDHPANFRAPQPMRLNPDQPFFAYAPSQLGDWKIEPGKPYVSQYRFVVSDGETDPKELDRLWNDYAEPPVVEFK